MDNILLGIKCNSQEEWDEVLKYYGCTFRNCSFDKNGKDCFIAERKYSKNLGVYSDIYSSEFNIVSFEEFCKLKNINTMKYKEGDIIVNDNGNKRKILAVCGELYAVSNDNHFDEFGYWDTESYLDSQKYKLYEEPKVVELTLEDIAKKFEVDVDNLKIKK